MLLADQAQCRIEMSELGILKNVVDILSNFEEESLEVLDSAVCVLGHACIDFQPIQNMIRIQGGIKSLCSFLSACAKEISRKSSPFQNCCRTLSNVV